MIWIMGFKPIIGTYSLYSCNETIFDWYIEDNSWFPQEFLPILSKALGYNLIKENKYLLLIPLLKVTRFFSYADEKGYKLCKSKCSRKRIEN